MIKLLITSHWKSGWYWLCLYLCPECIGGWVCICCGLLFKATSTCQSSICLFVIQKMWVIKKREIISPRLAEEGCQLVCLFYRQLSQKRVACFFQDNIGLENFMLEHLLSKATHLTLYRKIGLCPVKPAHQKSALQHYQKKSADFQWAGLCSLAFQRMRIERPLKFKRQGRKQRWQLEWLAGRVGWVITQASAEGEEIILINFLPQSS